MSEALRKLPRIDFKKLARSITLVENNLPGSDEILRSLQASPQTKVIGITGPPGAGKSTLINNLVSFLSDQDHTVAILAVDPTSPFNFGALLGDRIRMMQHFDNPNIYIRSIATRGALGGISSKSIEVVDVMRNAGFDYIIIETVGVGQSEVEIAGLADMTIVVLVPEAGDEIQVLKSGLMEIADTFVVNKADRPNAVDFVNNLRKMTSAKADNTVSVIQTIATNNNGVEELYTEINRFFMHEVKKERQIYLLAEKAYRLIRDSRMRDIDKGALLRDLAIEFDKNDFNLYRFIGNYSKVK